jgi:transcriptional regulator with XRE-family HTH domain
MREHGWTQEQTAAKLGLAQGTISSFLRGTQGAGRMIVQALSRVTKRTENSLLGRPDPVAPMDPTIGDDPEWDKATAVLRHMNAFEPYVFEHVGRIPRKHIVQITPDVAHGLLSAWVRSVPEDMRAQMHSEWRKAEVLRQREAKKAALAEDTADDEDSSVSQAGRSTSGARTKPYQTVGTPVGIPTPNTKTG